MGAHIVEDEFQSDKYPTTPRGKVPLSVKDATAQDLLWQYAERRRAVDPEFSADLQAALNKAGYVPGTTKPDDKTRKAIQDQLAALAAADAAIETAMKPFRTASSAVFEARELLFELYAIEVAGTCESCDRLLFVGDRGHHCEDGPTLCAEHAPSWSDAEQQWQEAAGSEDDDEERRDLFTASLNKHLAAGGTRDDKITYEL